LGLALLASVSLLTEGCGGISASKTVSPLDFFLPGAGGFLKADPVTTNAPALFPETAGEVASVK